MMVHPAGMDTTVDQERTGSQDTMEDRAGTERQELQGLWGRQVRAMEQRMESWEDQDQPDATDLRELTERTCGDVPDRLVRAEMRHQLSAAPQGVPGTSGIRDQQGAMGFQDLRDQPGKTECRELPVSTGKQEPVDGMAVRDHVVILTMDTPGLRESVVVTEVQEPWEMLEMLAQLATVTMCLDQREK